MSSPTAPSDASGRPSGGWGLTQKLLAGILGALLLLVAATATLAGVVYTVARPTVAPTGPPVTVTVDVAATNALGTATVTTATGISTKPVGGESPSSIAWKDQVVAYGDSVDVTIEYVTQVILDGSGTSQITCAISDASGKQLASAAVEVVRGTARCAWTNHGG